MRPGFVEVAAVLGENAECRSWRPCRLVSVPLVDLEAAAVLRLGFVEVASIVGEDAELVIGGGHACFVSESFDVEAVLVALLLRRGRRGAGEVAELP